MPEIFNHFGVFTGMIVATFTLLSGILYWVLKNFETQIKQAQKEREAWYTVLMSFSQNIQTLNESLKNHDLKADERGKFVREEHLKMLDSFNDLCTFTKTIPEHLQNINLVHNNQMEISHRVENKVDTIITALK